MKRKFSLLAGAILGLVAFSAALTCATADVLGNKSWISTHQADHPLVGMIWATASSRFISQTDLYDVLGRTDIVALGETHDNPDHHRLQAAIIEAMAKHGREPAITLEMIPRHMDDKLQRYLARKPDNAAALGAVLEWKKRGWPDWEIYRPIAETAIRLGLKLHAGGLSRAHLRAIAAGKPVQSLDRIRQAWRLDEPLPASIEAHLLGELRQAHCRLMPESMLRIMIPVQRARDAVLADTLTRTMGTGASVLIAGAGHVRRDWAVPAVIRRRFPNKSVVAIIFVEADTQRTDAADYLPQSADGQPVFDYLIFTPRFSTIDHCAQLRKQLKK
jgi:uncharacterized iron-regulated protein